jgi:hypothetical protein
MPARYAHIVDSDVEEKILMRYGITKKDDEQANLPKTCNVCEMPNAPESTICSKCGKPLDLKTVLELEEKQQENIKKIVEEAVERMKSGLINDGWSSQKRD